MNCKDKQEKPLQAYYLPQINFPFQYVVDNLKEMGIEYQPVNIAISLLKPLQKNVDFDKVMDFANTLEPDDKNYKPIFISEKNHILDGHHRVAGIKYKFGENAKVRAIKLINCDDKDGFSRLRIIQDRYEREYKNK